MSLAITRPPGPVDYGMLLLLAAIWGSSFLLIKVGVSEIPPLTVAAMRLALAAVVMVPLMLLWRQSIQANARTWAFMIVTGLLGNALPFFLINWGQVRIDSGLSAILMGVMPLITYVLSHLVTTDEKLNRWKLAGVVIGFAGMIVLIGPDKLLLLGQETVSQLAVVAGAACYAVNAVMMRRLGGQPPVALVATMMLISLTVLAPLSLWLDRPWTLTPSAVALGAVCLLGVLQTGLATLLMMAILRRQGASFFSQMNFLVPLIGVAWGMALLGEQPSAHALVALGMVLAGIALARRGTQTAAAPAKT